MQKERYNVVGIAETWWDDWNMVVNRYELLKWAKEEAEWYCMGGESFLGRDR